MNIFPQFTLVGQKDIEKFTNIDAALIFNSDTIYLSNSISSTESDVNIRLVKAWTVIDHMEV